MTRVCGPEKSGGLEMFAGFRLYRKKILLEVEINNISSGHDVGALAVQLNKNSFGLSPATQQLICDPPIAEGDSGTASIEMTTTPNMLAPVPAGQPAPPTIQVAIKNMQ